MRRANKLGAAYALIVGDQELDTGKAVLRDLTTREQVDVPLDSLVPQVAERIAGGS